MAPSDPGLTRLEAVKQVALDFIRSRPQDRIGLVVFSANAYLVNLLTTDHQVLSEYIEMVDGNTLIGEGLTSVGEGLRLSNDLLSFFLGADKDREGKAIIVFTDAEHNYGRRPNRPLERARQNKTRVYFVGVGVPIESVLGALTSVVRETGGDYFNASHVEELRFGKESCTDHRVPSQPGPLSAASYSGQLFAGGGLRFESLSQFLCDRIARLVYLQMGPGPRQFRLS